MKGIKKQPVTLINVTTSEEKQFDSTTSAAAFLGVNPSTITRSKKMKRPVADKDGVMWQAMGKVGRSVNPTGRGNSKYDREHRGGIIAAKNLGSIDDDHPEETINFADAEAAAEHFGISADEVKRRMSFGGSKSVVDRWYFYKVNNKDTNALMKAIYEDDGTVNLDEADEPW